MKRPSALAATLVAGCALIFTAQAAPPEGKGPGHNAGHSGRDIGNSQRGGPGKGNAGHGNQGKGNAKGATHARGNSGHGNGNGAAGETARQSPRSPDRYDRRDGRPEYDERGRHYEYFDDHRDERGHYRGGDLVGDLLLAGITAATARDYASRYGLEGYASLPPGIRKNLARGKPLPPGIAKKVVPGVMLARLPQYPGYEWRIAGSDLILVAMATAVVADILYDVFD